MRRAFGFFGLVVAALLSLGSVEALAQCVPSPEVCDGVDNDCDGKTDYYDNTLVKPLCEKQVGLCAGTKKSNNLCVAGVWRACTDTVYRAQRPTYLNPDSPCDGVDSDCDGTADDNYVAPATQCGTGACASTGVLACVDGVPSDTCVPGTPGTEVANFIDDDCDGETDEGLTCTPVGLDDPTCDFVDDDCDGVYNEDYVPVAGTQTCGVGACQATSVLACVDGAVVEQCTPGAPSTEVCDTLDNDCDGATDGLDNSIQKPLCEKQADLCLGTLKSSNLCIGGTWAACTDSVYLAQRPTYANPDAACDGVDSDCDGAADDNYTAPATQCGTGACASTGTLACVGGATSDTCVPGTPGTEVTNFIDDDCDGQTDENGACTPIDTVDTTCDFVDDDCDGTFNEDYVPTPSPTTCGVGECFRSGQFECQSGALVDVCTAGAPSDEICDTLDNDCDGKTDGLDNSIVKPACEKQFDLCLGTVKSANLCVSGAWTACTDSVYLAQRPAYVNPDAACDGVDSDCDGTDDDNYVAPATQCGTGACASTGVLACVGGATSDTCAPGTPGTEVANFIDDDCDGQTDEGLTCTPIDTVDTTCDFVDDDCDGTFNEDYVATPGTQTCGVGACQATSMFTCVDGAVTETCTPGAPSTEVCDTLDNDCDGKVDGLDNSITKPACENQAGVCAGSLHAANQCVSGVWQACTAQVYDAYNPAYDTVEGAACDGLDNDCDASTDEAFVSSPTTCGLGVCASTGVSTCEGGVPGDTCVAGLPTGPDDTCDATDDDCDGTSDEDYLGPETSCGVGACATIGHIVCVAGATVDDCTPPAGAPDDTSCDGVDSDCDGPTDEDYVIVELAGTCGVGGCLRHEQRLCVNGATQDVCTPGTPQNEVCNGIDDNCNGFTDAADASAKSGNFFIYDKPLCEKQAGVCLNSIKSVAYCVAGVWKPCTAPIYLYWAPTYVSPETAACDGLDNDCDAGTDEAYVATPTGCGQGVCASTGAIECQGGVEVDTCAPLPPTGDDTDCDTLDDDCDGLADNHFPAGPNACGIGACASTGTLECSAGTVTDTCVPGTPGPDDQSCDSVDNDCDGLTDEDCCTAHFTNLPASGFLNNSLCTVPGANCASVDVDLSVDTTGVCVGLDGFELWVDGALVDVAPAIGNVGTFPAHAFAEGLSPSLVVRAMAGVVEIGTSVPEVVTADLTDPVVLFTEVNVGGFLTPTSGSAQSYGAPDDQNAGLAGIQIPMHVQVTDVHADGGFLDPITGDTGTGPVDLAVGSPTLPVVLGPSPAEQTVVDVTIPEGSATISTTAADAAGNEASTTFQMGTDLTPPSAVVLSALDPAEIDRRLPTVVLHWTAPGDDGDVGLATAYDIRFSTSPITDDATFNAACPVDDVTSLAPVAVPQAQGTAESLVLSGPDVRPSPSDVNPGLCKFVTAGAATTYYFAVRAIDEVGNASPISATEVASTSELAVKTAQLTFGGALAEARMDRLFTPLGDINNDGLADFSTYSSVLAKSCVVLGQNDGTPALDIPDLSFTTDASDTHQCFNGTGVGYMVAGLGDIDGDGVRDWAIGYGGPTEHIDVIPGVTTGLPAISTTPYLTITGQSYSTTNLGSQVYSVGDFDGDGLADIGVGSRRTNVFYIVLGNDLLAPGDPVTNLDVTNAASYGSFRVVRVTLTGGAVDSYFGMNAAAAGNMLPDVGDDATPPQEVAIYQQNSPNQVFLLKGREVLTGPVDLEVSASATGTALNNGEVVRFFKENTAVEGLFGIDLSGGADLDGGGIPDLVIGHYRQAQNQPALPYSVYVFSGETIQVKLGNNVKGVGLTTPPPAAVGEGVLVGSYGVILQGSFRRPAILGDFDGAADGRADLVMHDLSASTWGSAWVRLNPADVAQSIAAGTFPYADLAVTSPYTGDTPAMFGSTVFPLSDFNGDGYPDILVGTNPGSFPTIVY